MSTTRRFIVLLVAAILTLVAGQAIAASPPDTQGAQAAIRYLGNSASNDCGKSHFYKKVQGIANGDPAVIAVFNAAEVRDRSSKITPLAVFDTACAGASHGARSRVVVTGA